MSIFDGVDLTLDVKGDGERASAYALCQNYPNPFNPATSIPYQIAGVTEVRLAVFDQLGREVARLVNEQKQPGSYTVRFDGAGLASGCISIDWRPADTWKRGSFFS